ncbi:hypothetical protein F5883DRAFT_647422 [Diaporthe sp. PMI_573]|nr:hypothetical protein F5883DRAFT_647422 [Diaporthaceae sp. PMI_573]
MASHDSPDYFTALPIELLQEILLQMDSPEDLYAAIHASKRLSQAFSGLREQILITVIESSLDPGIFIEILGLLHVPDYKGLNHVAEGPRPELPGEEMYLAWPTDWHEFCRKVEQLRLLKEFRYNHVNRIDIASSSGDIEPFPVPRARRTDDAEQRAHFKREVNDVAEIYGQLWRHMKHWHIYETEKDGTSSRKQRICAPLGMDLRLATT